MLFSSPKKVLNLRAFLRTVVMSAELEGPEGTDGTKGTDEGGRECVEGEVVVGAEGATAGAEY